MQMDLMEICNMGPMDPGTWEKMVSLEVIQWQDKSDMRLVGFQFNILILEFENGIEGRCLHKIKIC